MADVLYDKCKNLSILLVDDYLPLQKRMLSVFEDYFKDVAVACDGKEGLEKYLSFKKDTGNFYDIVMTDYEMPNLNGLELIKAIKRKNVGQVSIVISAYQEPENLIEFINMGITHFISKPFGTKNILNILDRVTDEFICVDNNILCLNDSLIWYKKEKSLVYRDKQIYLAKYDLLLLEVLLDYFNFNCPIDAILNGFYINNEDIKQDNIRNMVMRLRKKIPNIIIENIYGVGYKLSVDDTINSSSEKV